MSSDEIHVQAELLCEQIEKHMRLRALFLKWLEQDGYTLRDEFKKDALHSLTGIAIGLQIANHPLARSAALMAKLASANGVFEAISLNRNQELKPLHDQKSHVTLYRYCRAVRPRQTQPLL